MEEFKLRKKIARRKFLLFTFFFTLFLILVIVLFWLWSISIWLFLIGFFCLILLACDLGFDFKFKFRDRFLKSFGTNLKIINKEVGSSREHRKRNLLFQGESQESESSRQERIAKLRRPIDYKPDDWVRFAFREAQENLDYKKEICLYRAQLRGINVFVFRDDCIITEDFRVSDEDDAGDFDPVSHVILFYCALVNERKAIFRFAKYLIFRIVETRKRCSHLAQVKKGYNDVSWMLSPVSLVFKFLVETYILEGELLTIEFFEARQPEILNLYYGRQSYSYLDSLQTVDNGIIASADNVGKFFLDRIKSHGFNGNTFLNSALKYFAPVLRSDATYFSRESSVLPSEEVNFSEPAQTKEVEEEDVLEEQREVVEKVDTRSRDEFQNENRVVVSTEDFKKFEMKPTPGFFGQIMEGFKSIGQWRKERKKFSLQGKKL